MTNPADHSQGDRLAGEDKHMNEPMSPITPEAVELRQLADEMAGMRRGQSLDLPAGEAIRAGKAILTLLSTLQAVRGENERLREALGKIHIEAEHHSFVAACIPANEAALVTLGKAFQSIQAQARQALSTIQNGGGEGGDFNADLSSAKRADHHGERSAGWRDFNLNYYVQLRLTELGLNILRRNHEAVFSGLLGRYPFTPPEPNADGWVEMQAWEVMREFGQHIGMGRPVPFETTIRIQAPPASTDLSGPQQREAALEHRMNKTPSPEEE